MTKTHSPKLKEMMGNESAMLKGTTLPKLIELENRFRELRRPFEAKWKQTEAYYNGDFWDLVKKKLPKHQIVPDTNYVRYTVNAKLNNLYSGPYRGSITARSAAMAEETRKINSFIDYQWDKIGLGHAQLAAASKALKSNISVVEIGWADQVFNGPSGYYKGDVEYKVHDILSVYLDPIYEDYNDGRAVFLTSTLNRADLSGEPMLKDSLERLDQMTKLLSEDQHGRGHTSQVTPSTQDMTVKVSTVYYKYVDKTGVLKIAKTVILNDMVVAYFDDSIPMREFPIAVLYENQPEGNPYGVSDSYTIMKSAFTINMLDSITATHAYVSQRRPRIVNANSGINLKAFIKHGSSPDALFPVAGSNAALEQVVRYLDQPDLPAYIPAFRQQLENSIMLTTGVDARYTGRDTGSVQTTGGVDLMQQAIATTDNTRVKMLEKFIVKVTKVVLAMYLDKGDKMSYPVMGEDGQPIVISEYEGESEEAKDFDYNTIDFKALSNHIDDFDFNVHITPHLPKNMQRRAEAANLLMEKAAQYGKIDGVDLITPEEWLREQEFPQKDHIMQRMRAQREWNEVEKVAADIGNFVGLTDQGATPDEALGMIAEENVQQRTGNLLGNISNKPTR